MIKYIHKENDTMFTDEKIEWAFDQTVHNLWTDIIFKLGLNDHDYKDEIVNALIFAYDWDEDYAKKALKTCSELELAVLREDYDFVKKYLMDNI